MTTPEGEEIKAAPVSGKVATIEVGQSSKVITVALHCPPRHLQVAREDGAGVVLCVKARDRSGAAGDSAIPAFTIAVQDVEQVTEMINIRMILMMVLIMMANINMIFSQCMEGEWHVEQPCLAFETLQ